MARAERKRRERREQVLTAARRVFSDKGYHAASIGEIIETAQIARGTFYLYFSSKRAIFAELLENFFLHLTRKVRVVDMSPGAKTPREQLHIIVGDVLRTLLDNRDLTRILLREALGVDDEFDQKLSEFYDRVLKMVQHSLETGQALGLVRECDPVVVSHCMLGSIKELADHLMLQAELGSFPELDAVTCQVLWFNLDGVLQY